MMSNVVKLFQYDKVDDNRFPLRAAGVMVEGLLVASGQLSSAVEELSRCLDAIDNVIDGLGDKQTRDRQKLSMKLHREALIDATLELSKELKTLSVF